jgi:hypothetical protein
LCLDDLGYVKLDSRGSELLFQLCRGERKGIRHCGLEPPVLGVGPDHSPNLLSLWPSSTVLLSTAHHRDRIRLLPLEGDPFSEEKGLNLM